MDLVGIEPTTSSMPWKRAPSCATGPLGEGQLLYCLRSYPIRQTGSSQPQFPLAQSFTQSGIGQLRFLSPHVRNPRRVT